MEVLSESERALKAENEQLRARITELERELGALRTVTENSPDPIFLKDREGRILLANPATFAVMGRPAETVIGRTDEECYEDPSVSREIEANDQRVMASGRTEVLEEVIRAHGRTRVFITTKAPVRDAEGRVIGLIGVAHDITGRKRLEEQLRRKMEELGAVMEVAPAAIWVARDPLCDKITGNQMANRFYEAAEGENVSANLTPARRFFRDGRELAPEELPMQQAAARGVDIRDADIEVLLPSGRRFHMLGQASPLWDQNGAVRGCVGAFLDITVRKRVEAALAESEERLRLTLEGAQIGTFEYRPQTAEVIWGERSQALWGISKDRIDVDEMLERIHTEDRPRFQRTMAAALEPSSSGSFEAEFRIVRPDGCVRWTVAKGRVQFEDTADGRRAARLAGIHLDTTERKRAEQALRDSEARERARAAEIEAVMDAVPVATFVSYDPECRHMTGSRMMYELLRMPAGSNVSFSAEAGEVTPGFRILKDGKDLPPEQMPVQMAARTGQPVQGFEMELLYNDGSRRNLLGNAVPLLDENGRSRGAVAGFIDVTERRKFEEHLRQAQKLESVGLLAGGIAHDFNNLLVGIIGNASLAKDMLLPGDPATDLLDGVIKTGEQAAHLTRQMLAYSGKGRFVVEPVNLSDLIPDMSGLVQSSISKRIALEVELAQDLPLIEADRGQLQQVFMNLLLNAAEAIGSSAGAIRVGTAAYSIDPADPAWQADVGEIDAGRYVCLEVRDTGCGMTDETRSRIFDPFFSTKFTGRGLGLAAVAGVVRGHKGALRVVSAPGAGSCFQVLFPVSERATAAATFHQRTSLHGSGTVLVVDDEQVVREIARKSLQHYGYRVMVADGGPAAIDAMKRHPGEIALVILDLSMPGIGGEEVLPEIRKIRPDVKVCISSGYSETETLKHFKGSRICGFIQKPYTSTVLAEKVKAALS